MRNHLNRFGKGILLALLLVLLVVPTTFAQGANVHVVERGDTLSAIAQQYGTSWRAIMEENGLQDTVIYPGQRLTLPQSSSQSSPAPAPSTTQGANVHVVERGDTLSAIAQQYGTSWRAIMEVNGLQSTVIQPGQRLTLPQASSQSNSASTQSGACSVSGANGERWIEVNISTQRIYACEGHTAVYSAVVSTGTSEYPTVTGTYHIWVKLRYDDMQGGSRARGDYYYLEDVPYVMYFYRGYGIHGTYWHNNFGTPMSHGCVNLTIPDARWFFDWANVGTKVVTHY